MAKHNVKCAICNKIFDANVEEYVMINSRRYAHKSCFEGGSAENPQGKVQAPAADPKRELLDYCKEIYGDKANYAMIQKQIVQYQKEYGYTLTGILKTLKYFYEVKHNSPDKSNGAIGIVPFVYNEASRYYYDLHLAAEAATQVDLSSFHAKVKVIEIDSPKGHKKRIKLFGLLGGER